ncbi:ead/Ea22-like family protein [Salmonella enterica]|uniref:ead/Ea22-like family protein n=1 Tax=Salmonella enterica TaxID=28901 RepID=UPI000B8ECEC7|nr:ead/Ea22-like family protein [Salmonella enterica]EBP3719494.1 ead/Ea22-like family protein [Salmonella enterica subsp. enterica]EHE7036413.1 ead/Ea22-like family protein [Salmonella enterica subsp. enterica serovar Newport]EAA8644207.1 ead/Ea22-like family protein [Salmonella enterica]EAQ7262319.1 ead/Ea22-like family protein [Salmonella enterica]EAT9908294.1 ead/Ea22-like family protein [Salmonella enterica]
MSNIDKQAVTAKTKELASLMVERFSMNPVSCKLLNEAWEKEFPDEVAIAERMLALLDELEHYKSREERVTKLVLDNSTSWDVLYEKLEAAEKRIAEQREYYEGVIADGSKRIAELEAREISLPERSSMLYRTDFHEDYHTVMAYKVSDVIAAIRAAGIKVKGE